MELRSVLESGDVAEIRAKYDALQEAWTDAASAIYAQASATQPSSDGGSTAPDDEVIEDADYEVVDDGEEAKTSLASRVRHRSTRTTARRRSLTAPPSCRRPGTNRRGRRPRTSRHRIRSRR